MRRGLIAIVPVDQNGHVVGQIRPGWNGNLKPAFDGHRGGASVPTQRARRIAGIQICRAGERSGAGRHYWQNERAGYR